MQTETVAMNKCLDRRCTARARLHLELLQIEVVKGAHFKRLKT